MALEIRLILSIERKLYIKYSSEGGRILRWTNFYNFIKLL